MRRYICAVFLIYGSSSPIASLFSRSDVDKKNIKNHKTMKRLIHGFFNKMEIGN